MDNKRGTLYGLTAIALAGVAVSDAGLRSQFDDTDHFASVYDPFGMIRGGPSDAPVVLGRRGQKLMHVPVPNPRAEERKRRAVAEMQARKARKRARSALSRAE